MRAVLVVALAALISGSLINGSPPSALSATATLATAQIAANACAADQTIAVANAPTGAPCLVAMPTTIESGLLWSCFVSSAGNVKLRVCNHTASPITPAGSQIVAVRVLP
jgi:hypothetical protein